MLTEKNEVKLELESDECVPPHKQQKYEPTSVGLGLGPPIKQDPLGKWETVYVK